MSYRSAAQSKGALRHADASNGATALHCRTFATGCVCLYFAENSLTAFRSTSMERCDLQTAACQQ